MTKEADYIILTWQQFMGMSMMLADSLDIEKMTEADQKNIQLRIHKPKDGGSISFDIADNENGSRLRKLRSRKRSSGEDGFSILD